MTDYEDCTPTCRSREHGSELARVISCDQFSDVEVLSFLTWRCANFNNIFDKCGRSLAHVAAEAGRLDLLRHFLSRRDCLNEQDEESNYTLLHCCLLHGQVHCAVRLIQLGANMTTLDNDHFSPRDICLDDIKRTMCPADELRMRIGVARTIKSLNLTSQFTRILFADKAVKNVSKLPPIFSKYDLCEPYIWGTNNHYTLGLGHNRERLLPEPHDFFRRNGRSVVQVALQKFHSVFVCYDGSAWSCGHGAGGRIGQNTESPCLEPNRVAQPETVKYIAASIAEDHTILLMDIGLAWTCGQNTHRQLGINPPPASLLAPKPIRTLSKLRGVCAAQCHSVFWNKNQVFTCGFNGGQLGHPSSDEYIVVPKEVVSLNLKGNDIEDVSSSAAAIAVVDGVGAVYLITNYRCSKITSRQWLRQSQKILVQGGTLQMKNSSSTGDFGELKVLLLCNNNIYIWRSSTGSFLPCLYSVRRELLIADVAVIKTGCIFSTLYGEAFMGFFRDGKKAKTVEILDVRQLPHVHRATSVAADPWGRNMAVLQASPRFGLNLTPPKVGARTLRQELGLLLEETTEDDLIHDIIFKVGGMRFPAHRYIVFHSNEDVSMKKVLEENKGNDVPYEVDLQNIPLEAFKKVLLYIYTMTCDLIEVKCSDSIPYLDAANISAYEGNNNNKKRKEPQELSEVSEVRFVARRLGVSGLIKELGGKKGGSSDLCRKGWKFDCSLKSNDGATIHVHKCVLVARSDYFKVMLTHGWRESQETELSVPVNGRTLEALVEFLYTDQCQAISECTDLEFLSLTLVAVDELFCEGLKRLTEIALVGCMTLRNSVDLLQLATTYNAPFLQSCAEQFICNNITAFLEAKSLEILSDESLERLSTLYRQIIPLSRKLRSSFDPIEVATVKSVAETFPAVMDLEAELAKPSAKTPTPKKKEKRERRLSERTRLISVDSVEEVPAPEPVAAATAAEKIATPSKAFETIVEVRAESKTSQTVLNRLRAIDNSLRSPPPSANLTRLVVKKDEVSLEKDFPQLNKPVLERTHVSATKVSPSEHNKKFTKMSQRERKRLATLPPSEEQIVPEVVPQKSAWAVIPPVSSNSPTSPGPTQLAAIIVSEKEERERAARMRSKPLYLTQLEDRAIHDLTVFYNADGATDERITVRRLVSNAPAPPVWVTAASPRLV